MIDFRGTRNIAPLARNRALGTVSALALFAAGLAVATPDEARAQAPADPSSPQCPIINRIVTCTGNLPGGVRVPAGADRDGLTVENLTADITLDLPVTAARPVIDYTAGTPTSTIRIVDADNRLSLTTAAPTTASAQNQVDRVTSAILLTATNNSNFSLLSDIDIVARATCPFNDCIRRREILPSGITVRGSLGNFAIDNRGDISLDIEQNANEIPYAISADVFNADLVTIRNSGNVTAVNAGGIQALIFNRRIEITNDGSISLQDNRDITVGGIALIEFQPSYADGFSRPVNPDSFTSSYRIVNNGSIRVAGAFNEAGIRHSSSYNIEGGFFRDLVATGEIVNNGTIDAPFGILFFHSGELTITNNGRIEGDTAMFVVQGGPGSVIARVANSASGVIATRRGIVIDGGFADVSNAGRVEANGDAARGIEVVSGIISLDSATIRNSGEVAATGNEAIAVSVIGSAEPVLLANSGTITAAGNNAIALFFEQFDLDDDDMVIEDVVGTAEVDLAASSIVRGGTGADGAGIRFFGGERNTVRNAGLIAADSGRAIVGGAGMETIDNSGRIEGSVVLAAGDDVMISRGGVVTGVVDGGAGNDRLTVEVASGTALFGDRFGGAVTGFELFEKTGTGVLTLNTLVAPRADLLGGTLRTNGALDGLAVNGSGGTVLEASGALGAVTLANGAALSPSGANVATLSLASLSLSGTSILRFDLGAPGVVGGTESDLINVAGNLILDGALDINARPNFGMGVYRLINYGGALTDNGLVIGAAPAATYTVQTSVAGQVNLVVAGLDTLSVQFWDDGDTSPDGLVDGGAGTWTAGRTNWTNVGGTANNAWAGNFAVFQNTGGAVTVEGEQGVTGMQFMANGYRLSAGAGGALSLNAAETIIRVDPGITAELTLPLTGGGALVKRDTGILILSGASSYTGGTIIREGVLEAASDTALGAAAGGVTLDGGTLRFAAAGSSGRGFIIGAGGGTIDHANALTLSGVIGGGGAFIKTGAGTLTLSGNSLAFTGATNINGGVLNLTGSLGGTLTIGNGARLGGNGTLGNLILASGGILAPGNSPGTLTATGNVIFRAGSFYDLELAAGGATDLLRTTGTATLEGGTVRVTALDPETQYVDGTRYTFLTATGGLTGTFAGLTETSAFLDFILSYDSNTAFVTVDVVRTFPDVAQSFNQRQASTALMAFNTGGTDALAVYNQLLLLDAGSAQASFDLASGEIYAVTLASTLRQAEGDARRLLAQAGAGSGEGWGLWGAISGQDGELESDGNGADFSHDAIQGTLGVDYRGAGNGWAIGVGGGFHKGDITLPARASNAETEGWHIGGYARYGTGGAGFTATLSASYATNDAEVDRVVAAGTITRAAEARVDVDGWGLASEARYGVDLGGGLAAGPLARIVHAHGQLGSFAEAGATSLNLTGGASNGDTRTRYGGGLFGRWAGANGAVEISAAYMTGDNDPTEIGLTLAGAPNAAHRVRAATGDIEGLELGIAGRLDLGGGWSAGLNANAFTSRDERHVTGSATIGWRF